MKKVSIMMPVIIPIIFGITLFATNAAGFKQWKSYSNIAVNKQWSITFNQKIDANSIENNVYMINSNNDKIAITATASGKVLKIKPVANLNHNSSYKIVVTNNLLSAKGKAMNQEIIIPFTTLKQTTSIARTAFKTFDSEYNFTWNMPTSNYNEFYLVGTKNKKTVGGYETRTGQTAFGITVGASRDTVKAKYGTPLSGIQKNNIKYTQNYVDKYGQETSGTYLIDNNYVTFFYDAHKNYKIRSITWVDAASELSKSGFFATPTTNLRNGFEDLMVELINQARVAVGLNALIYTPQYNPIARKHSTSMAENNYFSHVDVNGLRGGDRMKNGGLTFNWWGENLAYGQYSAIYAHEALMNSTGHRENILRKEFTHVFVGVDFNSKNQPYFTINFYSK
jgi:uncharacterized protein YkwD